MSSINIVGIDLASQPANTAACVLSCAPGSISIGKPEVGLEDSNLHRLSDGAQHIGIDAPFGWPQPFREAVASWSSPEWNNPLRDKMRFRCTDCFVLDTTREKDDPARPLSVSSDLIALPAMRAMALLHRFGVRDKSGGEVGGKRFFEVYPAASLCLWNVNRKGYKAKGASQKREEILSHLTTAFKPFGIEIPTEYAASDHALDALLSALSAYCAAAGQSHTPNADQLVLARQEGWIHLPSCSLGDIFSKRLA